MTDMFDYAQAYVAFSRVRTMAGLQILNKYMPKKIRADPKVHVVMERLRMNPLQHVHLTHNMHNATVSSTNNLNIIHLNVRGYLANLQDVLNDETVKSADVICFTETHLHSAKKVPKHKFKFKQINEDVL